MAVKKFQPTWAKRLMAGGLNTFVIASAALFLAMPSPHVASALSQVGDPLPPGAGFCPQTYTTIKAPFDAGARGTPLTSCAFVEQVRWTAKAEGLSTSSPPTQLLTVSPITRKKYELQCISAAMYVTCSGGEDAVVYLYSTRN